MWQDKFFSHIFIGMKNDLGGLLSWLNESLFSLLVSPDNHYSLLLLCLLAPIMPAYIPLNCLRVWHLRVPALLLRTLHDFLLRKPFSFSFLYCIPCQTIVPFNSFQTRTWWSSTLQVTRRWTYFISPISGKEITQSLFSFLLFYSPSK